MAQDPKDQKARVLQGQVKSVKASFESAVQKTQKKLANTEETLWNALLDTDDLRDYKFKLIEWRKKDHLQLPVTEEKLMTDLMVDGYHAWRQFYNTLMSDIRVHVLIDGELTELSMGQAISLRSHPDEKVRKESHKVLEDAWAEKEDLAAKVLNHIAGFRLQMYKHKGIGSVLQEPLSNNHMKEETLNAMWRAVEKHKSSFIDYLNKKAEMLGDSKLSSFNFWAPLTGRNNQLAYNEAVDFITDNLGEFGPEMEKFSQQAFEKGWVESENRSNKSAISFCAGFPLSGQSRVFMTYGGTIKDILALAHELGHAFHNEAMKSVEGINKQYPLSIAETASTFSEMVMLDAAIDQAKSDNERLLLLDEKLKRSVMNFMNIHSRFLFEKNFYEERKKGIVSPSRLNELMEKALNEGYKGSVESHSIRSWLWTPHFYITESPFYNFPYTFGYLFALSIYEKAKEKGKEFEPKYLALLRDSGSMTVEDLVMKHLGDDITLESFWEKGLKMCIKDAEDFVQLSEKIKNADI